MRACWSVIRFSSGSGGGAEAIGQLGAQLGQLADLAGARDPPVDLDLGLLVGDVVGGHVGVDVDVEPHGLGQLVLLDRAVAAIPRTASSSICM